MTRKPFIAGNWKMHNTVEESVNLVKEINPLVAGITEVDIAVCPTFPSLVPVCQALGDNIALGAQNMYYEEKGAFTGEVSGEMLKSAGCTYVILGHSERRTLFGEGNDMVNSKVKKALQIGLKPILCIGESKEERESGKTFDVLQKQLLGSLKDLTKEELLKVVLAYEPIWAIGTGITATPEDADSTIGDIRSILQKQYDEEASEGIRILYGGSVKPSNVKSLMEKSNIDGALVGGASLKAADFEALVKLTKEVL